MKAAPVHDVSLGQFSAAWIPFGILAMGALLWPETTQTLDLSRTRATIWVTSIMLGMALALYPFRTVSQGVANLAHLYWTAAYLLFLVHAYWAVFVIFNGVGDTFRQMGVLIAGVNFLLVIWWGIDVLLLWILRSESPRMARFQRSTRVFTFLVFAVTLLGLRGGAVRGLGIAFLSGIALALLIHVWARDRSDQRYA